MLITFRLIIGSIPSPSLFHSRLKTFLFCKSFQRSLPFLSRQFLCMLPMAVAPPSFGGVVIRYIFPVIWMTSYLHISWGCSTSPPGWGSEVHTQPWVWRVRINTRLQAADARDYFLQWGHTIGRRWKHRGRSLRSMTGLSITRWFFGCAWLAVLSADKDIDSKVSTNVAVRSDGTCIWIPPGLFESSCSIDISWFPYDDQRCSLKFGSWSYNGFQLDLNLSRDGFDLSNYVANGEWSLIGNVVGANGLAQLAKIGFRVLVFKGFF